MNPEAAGVARLDRAALLRLSEEAASSPRFRQDRNLYAMGDPVCLASQSSYSPMTVSVGISQLLVLSKFFEGVCA